MSAFNLEESIARAEKRLGGPPKRRLDHGTFRIDPAIVEHFESLVAGYHRPPMVEISRDLAAFCQERVLSRPSRATLYKLLAGAKGRQFSPRMLPADVSSVLRNLDHDVTVPGHQLAFYCFNYGGAAALSFAAGLPWLALYQAARLPGWRPKSRGLLEAVMRVRNI